MLAIFSLGITYDAAARVLGDRRLARLAEQVKVQLTVRARKLAYNQLAEQRSRLATHSDRYRCYEEHLVSTRKH